MSSDIVELASAATPVAVAALGAYGGAVLLQAQEEMAVSTVNVGRRLLQRIFGNRNSEQDNPEILDDLIQDPNDADNVATLRREIRRALMNDEDLAAWLRRAVASKTQSINASGERSVAIGTNSGVVFTGDNNQVNGEMT
ncbi:hypothetical protein [Streptomyces sp. ADI97-07]|uniref:hypothetical protein n=1 Tax=Streptomyces sp. ADI97-07 TaxID=1522762 RepID=UPI000F5568E9|nr:hypothetical protein [Streptomyces sp. ADI97-07]